MESIREFFRVGDVCVLHDVITFAVDPQICQLGCRHWTLVLTWFWWEVIRFPSFSFNKDVAWNSKPCRLVFFPWCQVFTHTLPDGSIQTPDKDFIKILFLLYISTLKCRSNKLLYLMHWCHTWGLEEHGDFTLFIGNDFACFVCSQKVIHDLWIRRECGWLCF